LLKYLKCDFLGLTLLNSYWGKKINACAKIFNLFFDLVYSTIFPDDKLGLGKFLFSNSHHSGYYSTLFIALFLSFVFLFSRGISLKTSLECNQHYNIYIK